MTWFKIDDGFWSHPKTLQLSDGALALWVRAGSWSMFHLTDGFIPDYALPLLRSKPRFVGELQRVSLWSSVKDGNQFHDWSDYQPTRESVQADRDSAAERKRKSREKSQGKSRVTDHVTGPDAAPTPTRPDPTRPKTEGKPSVPRSRGTRLNEASFEVTADMVAWAKSNAPAVNGQIQTEKFVNFWMAKSGRDAVKIDWVRTWRNWMLSAQERAVEKGWKSPAAQEVLLTPAQVRAKAQEAMNREQ